ncbi:MurR/RpiR family transcriptional regulator [Aeromonas sp. 102P]|uniref:MurR/RpiR family transcriptional regulator n=1 Tax=Aeromonas sp. 102P TaxID=3452711 RepID=UPI003F7B0C47
MNGLQPGNILANLSAMHGNLTKVSQRIADYIIANPALVTQQSIAQLSGKTQSGEATIIRFCRTLGYKGFQDFKLDLAIELELSKTEVDNSKILDGKISCSDSPLVVGKKIEAALNTVLYETLNLLDMEQVKSAVNKIKTAKYIFICGVGSSGVTAEDMKNKLMRIGYRVSCTSNNHFMYMQASLLTPGDVAIAISHTGRSAETVHTLKLAKEAGASTIALTHSIGSPLIEHADISLINGNQQGVLQGDSIGTKIAQLFVFDLIYTLLVQSGPESLVAHKIKTVNALKSDLIY